MKVYILISRQEHVADPIDVVGLEKYFQDLPQFQSKHTPARASDVFAGEFEGSSLDPLRLLPPEILTEILTILPKESVVSLKIASKFVNTLSLRTSFWKRRIQLDMPWFYELPGTEPEVSRRVDWPQVYLDLKSMSRRDSPTRILGLQVARVYLKRRVSAQAYRSSSPSSTIELESCRSLQVPCVSFQTSINFTPLSICLLPQSSLVQRADIFLELFWTSEGYLRGIKSTIADKEAVFGPAKLEPLSKKTQEGINIDTTTRNKLIIDHGDHIQALELTLAPFNFQEPHRRTGITGITIHKTNSQPESVGNLRGNKRLLPLSLSGRLYGFQGESANGIISRFGLIECASHLDNQSHATRADLPQVTKMLWKDSLPSPESTRAWEYKSGYWKPSVSFDMVPMEPLIFRTSDLELSQVTGFCVARSFKGFQVRYSDRTIKRIGRSHENLKVFLIDGGAGERIVGMTVIVTHLPSFLRVVTNFSRQSVFGEYPLWQVAPNDYVP